jgi:endonuclease-3
LKQPAINLPPKQRLTEIITLLKKQYPNAKTALNYTNPLEILVATMLSAQTTDVRVNIVTQTLFKKYSSPQDYANADLKELETDIHSTGFYHNKAKNLKVCCATSLRKIPQPSSQTMPELLELPGWQEKLPTLSSTTPMA